MATDFATPVSRSCPITMCAVNLSGIYSLFGITQRVKCGTAPISWSTTSELADASTPGSARPNAAAICLGSSMATSLRCSFFGTTYLRRHTKSTKGERKA